MALHRGCTVQPKQSSTDSVVGFYVFSCVNFLYMVSTDVDVIQLNRGKFSNW